MNSCIKTFEPIIESNDAVKFVVTGEVSNGNPIQRINISTTSPIGEPRYIPVSGCIVKIIDDKENSYDAIDIQDGNYEVYIPESALTVGSSFKVDIFTPGGINISSDFDQLNECPDVDSIYYVLKDVPTPNPKKSIKGIQFYIDLDASMTNSHYFRWEALETWEHHSTWPREWYYDGTVHHIFPPDYSRFVCWNTRLVKNIFTLSTKDLVQNNYSFFPLHFVDNYSTSRLVYGYSVLIRQFALSEAAYAYWEKIRINSSLQGGLYEKQPLAIRGNMHNITNPDQNVLGFFGVSSVKVKRIFVSNVPDLPLEYDPNCIPGAPMRGGLKEITEAEYPAYLDGNHETYFMRLLETACVDCLSFGGTNVKPAFWPN
jgi:hypothetical protein